MGIFHKLIEFFQTLMNPSSEDAAHRMAVRRMESEIRILAPNLYKNGLVQVNFAEALRVLYVNTKPIADILGETICSPNRDYCRRYTEQLILTGFSDEAKEILGSLSYETRKNGAREASSMIRYFESEHRRLEKVVRELNSQDFVKIDLVLDKLKQLNDICHYSYLSALRIFDTSFSPMPDYVPSFQGATPDLLENSLLDLYYVIAGMDISNSLFNATVALYSLKNGGNIVDKTRLELKENFKKVQSICKHVFTKEILMCLIRIAKKSIEFIPDRAVYKENYRQKYADYLENKFRVDEARLKGEIQDEKISADINHIFDGMQMVPVTGYSTDLNFQLMQSTPCSFMWITPLYILKNFIHNYFDIHVKPLLNDIVIEGFFNNPTYKSEFSADVFACNDAYDRVCAFENRFQRGNDFDEANITGLIHDSHKDTAFENTLKDLVDKVNREAKEVIQTETSHLFQLYKKINDIIVESKKPSTDMITNLKVLMISSRNKENSEAMESQNSKWNMFLDVMKNYVIIGSLEKK